MASPSSSSSAPYAPLPSSASSTSRHSRAGSTASLSSLHRRRRSSRVKLAAISATVVVLLLAAVVSYTDGVGAGLRAQVEAWRSGSVDGDLATGAGGHTREEEGIWSAPSSSSPAELGEAQEQEVGVDASLGVLPASQGEGDGEETVVRIKLDHEQAGLEQVNQEVDDGMEGASATEDEEDTALCTDAMIATISQPSFWIIRDLPAPAPAFTSNSDSSNLFIIITPRTPVLRRFPHACLAHAVFSARLISASETVPDSELEGQETIRALPRPHLMPHSADYGLNLTSTLTFASMPRGDYRIEVRLEFGFLPGAIGGQVCGEERRSCEALKEGRRLGSEVSFIGGVVGFEEEGKAWLHLGDGLSQGEAQDDVDDTRPPVCDPTALGRLEGYWSHSTFHPTTPSGPCSLIDLTFPLPFVPAPPNPSPSRKKPIWLNFVGDSNTRNFAKVLIDSLGNGPKGNAVVMDSPLKNGTVASIALRSRTGKQGYGDEIGIPDVIVTWSWWYQRAPTTSLNAQQWQNAVSTNRDRLLFLATAPSLAEWANQISLSGTLGRPGSPLVKLAGDITPARTYISLGSHGEALTSEGVDASLDYLLAEEGGLGREQRDALGIRFFTTTLVASSAIPLARFPHQDLLRNNVVIEAKNEVLRRRSDVGVVDVEALTRGVTEDWMKVDKKGMVDAVHFNERVYKEWARVVGTELMELVR